LLSSSICDSIVISSYAYLRLLLLLYNLFVCGLKGVLSELKLLVLIRRLVVGVVEILILGFV
jgi:hypothetical protein